MSHLLHVLLLCPCSLIVGRFPVLLGNLLRDHVRQPCLIVWQILRFLSITRLARKPNRSRPGVRRSRLEEGDSGTTPPKIHASCILLSYLAVLLPLVEIAVRLTLYVVFPHSFRPHCWITSLANGSKSVVEKIYYDQRKWGL